MAFSGFGFLRYLTSMGYVLIQDYLDAMKGGKAFVTVAASDASLAEKWCANYVATGTNDETVLAQATTAAQSGLLRLLGKNFYVGAAGWTIADCVVDGGWCGNDANDMGVSIRSAGTITLASGALRNVRIENRTGAEGKTILLVQPNSLNAMRGQGDLLRNIYVVDNLSKSAGSIGVKFNVVSSAGNSRTIERCEMDGVAVYGFDTGVSFYVDQSAGSSAWMNANKIGLRVYGSNTGVLVNAVSPAAGFIGNFITLYEEGRTNYSVDVTGAATSNTSNTFLCCYLESGGIIRTNGRWNRWFVPSGTRTQLDSVGDSFYVANGKIENVSLAPLSLGTASALTMNASGAITVGTGNYYTVDTYSGAATGNLDTISGGVEGQIIYLREANAARVVTIRNAYNNILNLGSNYTYANTNAVVVLMKLGSAWVLVSKS